MHVVDLGIILLYLAAVLAAGGLFARRQKTTTRYFLGGHQVPWWAISASIVATETSTVTLISIPGIVYARGGDFIAVLGNNGVGKTLTLHTLAGLRAPGAGTVELDGREIAGWSGRERARRIALLPQVTDDPFPPQRPRPPRGPRPRAHSARRLDRAPAARVPRRNRR